MRLRPSPRRRVGRGRQPVEAAAIGITVDAVAAELVQALRAADIRSILLKGASFDRWLYDADAPRPYFDVDLLVDPDDIARAGPVLTALGFARVRADTQPEHSEDWLRDGIGADLHATLFGTGAPPAEVWEALAERTERMAVGGVEVDVLELPARALHVALHAAQHGIREDKPLADLTRALERVPSSEWEEAAKLAGRLDATPSFATGLRLVPAGAQLAARLQLPAEMSMDVALSAVTASRQGRSMSRLAAAPGVAAKARMIRMKVLPDRAFMAEWYPVARRGRLGLLAAYVWRQIWLISRAGPAVIEWRRARRMAR
jgi:hypothetical protein